VSRKIHALATVAACLLAAPGAMGATLGEELAALVAEHPEIEGARKDVAAAGEEINKSFAGYLPSVSVSANIGPEVIDSPTRRQLYDDAWNRPQKVARLTVTQTLFDGFNREAGLAAARLGRQTSEAKLENTLQMTLFEAISAYIDVKRQESLVELARANERTIKQQLDLEDERVRRGSGIAVDVLQAKSRLQIAKERRVTFEGALQDAVTRYLQVFGHPPDIAALETPAPPLDAVPASLDEAVELAKAENPAVTNGGLLVETARERKRRARSDYFPTIDLVGRADYEEDFDGVLGVRRDYSVVVQANWNLFTGFATRAAVAQASFDYAATLDNLSHVTRKVVERTRLAWQAMETARNRVELLRNAVNIASEVFADRKRLREAGKETVINVLDAENEIYNAKINLTAATHDERRAVYQLLLAVGRLDPKTLGLQ
jgi:adhesin transport system outer membrane protein